MNNSSFCAVGFINKKRIYLLQLYLFFSRKKVYFYNTWFPKRSLIQGWFIKKGKISFQNGGLAEIKGLYYEVSKKALELAGAFFDNFINKSYLFSYMNRSLKTTKYECYLKKNLAFDILETLTGLYLVKEFSIEKKIILIDTPVNRLTLNAFLKENKIDLEVRWLNFSIFFWLECQLYCLSIMKTILINGIVFKNRKQVKLYREAVWGCTRHTFRDDLLIDNIYFKNNDIIFYSRYYSYFGSLAKEELRKAGHTVIDLKKCKLNLKNYLFLFIRTFLIQPFYIFLVAYFNKIKYQSDYISKFYLESLPHFLFLTNYDAKCHFSSCDYGEVAETIIMNMFGCKNMLYIWSDKTPFKDALNAFTAHNVFYSWGPVHYEFQKEFYYYDKVEIVGCVFLKAYFDALKKNNKEFYIETKKKTILMCDNSFSNISMFSEKFYLEYLDLVIDLLNEIPDANIIFKSKFFQNSVLINFSNEMNIRKYLEKINLLILNRRFIYYDGSFQIEPFIALADIVITMGMTSPSTIALILRKEAIYYDITGNNQHPMAKYKNSVVFDDKNTLIEHAREVLNKKKSVFYYIDDELLNSYDPYKDSEALNRLTKAVYEETLLSGEK